MNLPLAKWLVRDGVLGVQESDGTFWVPSAESIFAARSGEHTSTRLPLFAKMDPAIGDLTFARFPARVRIRVSRPPRPTGRLAVAVDLLTEGSRKPFSSPQLLLNGHVIVDGHWIPIAPDHLECLTELAHALGSDALRSMTLRQYLHLRVLDRWTDVLEVRGEDDEAHEVRDQLSEDFGIQGLYPYQRVGVAWLTDLLRHEVGGILADEMGLGKTVQLIAVLAGAQKLIGKPALVVGPTSILENWRRELSRFAPKLRVLVHRGENRTGFPSELRQFDVVVSSYETMVRDAVLFGQLKWGIVVADEAQYVKNRDTLRAQALRNIPHELVIASTGTPVENSLRDLWSLVDLVVPHLLPDAATFSALFPDDVAAARRLAEMTAPVVLRRRISDVAQDLPPRIEIPTALRFSDEEAVRYDGLRRSLSSGSSSHAFASLTKLRMFCAHPTLIEDDNRPPIEVSVKFARLMEVLVEIFEKGNKALVFASFQKAIDLIASEAQRAFDSYVASIDGRTVVERRQDIIDEFSATSLPGVLVLNPRAAGVGLNITAANHVIHYSPEWNPAVEDQATARAHRRGQEFPVTVHRLFYVDSVEEIINQRLQRKRDLMSSAVTETSTADQDVLDLVDAMKCSPLSPMVPDRAL